MLTAAFIKDESELNRLLETESLLIVDFTAPWCGPCKIVAPYMNKLATEYGNRLRVFKLDVDDNKEIARRFTVKSIPAVAFFKGGDLVETLVGVKPYEDYVAVVDRNL